MELEALVALLNGAKQEKKVLGCTVETIHEGFVMITKPSDVQIPGKDFKINEAYKELASPMRIVDVVPTRSIKELEAIQAGKKGKAVTVRSLKPWRKAIFERDYEDLFKQIDEVEGDAINTNNGVFPGIDGIKAKVYKIRTPQEYQVKIKGELQKDPITGRAITSDSFTLVIFDEGDDLNREIRRQMRRLSNQFTMSAAEAGIPDTVEEENNNTTTTTEEKK